ncbi:MAG: hypothetical protein JST84_28210 [Acidobacteria bacterium]|nr:hypothetical protein [Acidobacteriota bacterium]
MGNSRNIISCGRDPFKLSPLTPGPLGHNDFGNPDAPRLLLGDTPGSVGMKDLADPHHRLRLSWETLPCPEFTADDPLQMIIFRAMRKALVRAAEESEFKLLKGKINLKNVDDYIAYRNEYFGSAAEYEDYSYESDTELESTKGLRKLIEMGENPEAQKVFYRWVRKAYQKKGVNDVSELILRGNSAELKAALAKVRVAYDKPFKTGGFNPRPMKDSGYRYRLGTISEHAIGNAIDIESLSNPILSKAEWDFLIEFTGKAKVDLSLTRWNTSPQAMWKDVKDVNDEFVKKVASELKRIQDERQKEDEKLKAAGKPIPKRSEPLEVLLAKAPKLIAWKQGFFTLEWSLLEQLHKHKFRWGATFYSANVDLHHFELTN